MRHSRGPKIGVSRIKIRFWDQKLDTLRHSRGPDFSVSRLKIHIIGHKLDTLCATRADPNLAFPELKSVFEVKI